MQGLREEGLLTPEPSTSPSSSSYFDFWHYFGRTAKHGAFMGGADFVQWHGNYELLYKLVELKKEAAELREIGHPADAGTRSPAAPVARGSTGGADGEVDGEGS